MTAGELAVFASVTLVGVLLSASFSGLETGLYTLNRVRLTVEGRILLLLPTLLGGTCRWHRGRYEAPRLALAYRLRFPLPVLPKQNRGPAALAVAGRIPCRLC